MNLLILDDEPARHTFYETRYGKMHHIRHTTRYLDFAKALGERRWDYIFLDRDLDNPEFAPRPDRYRGLDGEVRTYNGVDAAVLVGKLPRRLRPRGVVVQSINEVGSHDIAAVLQSFGVRFVREPFNELVERVAKTG